MGSDGYASYPPPLTPPREGEGDLSAQGDRSQQEIGRG